MPTNTAAAQQPGVRMKWYSSPPRHIDTIVFVHGILGHYVNTWGEFPKLLHEDPDLPEVDILLWGYRTGIFAKHHDLETEGGHLAGNLETLIHEGRDIFLVGHSMGGLIILKSVVDRMVNSHADKHPCRSIKWITLYASPLSGAWAAAVARLLWGRAVGIRHSLDKHLKDMSRGEFITRLTNEVINRIYSPRIEDRSNRRIPIRLVLATNDGAVDEENCRAILTPYRDPAPLPLDYGHQSVKLPTHTGDERYKALTNDLQNHFRQTFQTLCRCAIDEAETVDSREAALTEISDRYGKIIQSRLRMKIEDPARREALQNDILRAIVQDGARSDRPPFDAINRAVLTLDRLQRLK